jgi:hypothetical protein
MAPRVLQALKSILVRPRPVVVEPPSPPPSSIISHFTAAMSIVQDHIPPQVKAAIDNFLAGKSQSELLFLTSILLAVLLFVIILPAYEALFGSCSYYEGDETDCTTPTSSRMSSPTRMKMYKAGVGIVEMDSEDIAESMLLRSNSGGSSSTSSTRSCGSCSSLRSDNLETIEESEEEDMEDEEDEEIHLFTGKDSTKDKAHYYEFLEFINSEENNHLLKSYQKRSYA